MKTSTILSQPFAATLLLAAVSLSAIPAQAITVSTGGAPAPSVGYGLVTAQAGAITIDFNEIDLSLQTTTYTAGPVTFSGLTAGSDGSFVIGNSAGQYAAPENDTTNYLSVGGSRSATVTIDFASSISYFGFYWGSPDTYNNVAFFDELGNEIDNYSPPNLIGSDYYNFNLELGDAPIAKVVLTSTSAALESDNYSYAVPEPTTMSLFGLVGMGFLFFRRRISAA